MKKFIVKIVLCTTLAVMCGLFFAGCALLTLHRSNSDSVQVVVYPPVKSLFSVCIDEDAEMLDEFLGESDFVLFEDYKQFVNFFGDRAYSEYGHLLRQYDDFNFRDYNMALLRTEPVETSKKIYLTGFSHISSGALSSSGQGEGMHYYLLVLEKSYTELIVLP